MGYRQQLMEMLGALNERVRSAAVTGKEKFLDFDQAYANKVGEFIYPEAQRGNNGAMGVARGVGKTGAGTSLRDMLNEPVTIVKENGQAPTARDHMIRAALQYGLPVTNVGARYVLPAAGVTLAGQGLYDLTQMFSPYEKDEDEV
jgi:hypothetical protein